MNTKKMPQAGGQGARTEIDRRQNMPTRPACQLKFTLITKSNGPLTKIIRYQDGKPVKDLSECWLSEGTSQEVTTSLKGFAESLRSCKPNQALIHGISGHKEVKIVSERNFKGQCGTITRTKKSFGYPRKNALTLFDYDVKPGIEPLSHDAWLKTMSSAVPGFEQAGYVVTPSTSACIYDKDGHLLAGDGYGFHHYVIVQNSADIPRFNDVLFKRLWLAGYGYIFVSRSGAQLERTIYDQFVMSPERLDFVAGAVCRDGLEQRLPDPVYVAGAVLDTTLLPSLSKSEEAGFKRLVEQAKQDTRDEADTVRAEYLKTEVPRLAKRLKVSQEEARKILSKRVCGTLSSNDILEFDNGGFVSARDILKDPKKYHLKTLRDPVEPEQGNYRAKLFVNKDKSIIVNSCLHGGRTYKLQAGLVEDKTEPEGQAIETPDDLLDFEIKRKPHLDLTKFSGLPKAFVELATLNSEADPAAVLFTFLARFGVEIGRNPFFNIGDTTHHGQLAAVIVGESAKSRKGTSGKPVEKLFSLNSFNSSNENRKYISARTSPGPFSSGEGIIYAVRDPIEAWDRKKQATEIIDPGIDDKRLYVLDEEFGGVLTNTKREGNTLSMVIRCAWDNGRFDPLTKNSKISAIGAHVGWVSHITNYELKAKLPECEGFNGFANRILWVFSQRQKLVPMPEPMPSKELAKLQNLLLPILNKCHESEIKIPFTKQAQEAWIDEYYQRLTLQNENGLLGVILNRSEAQVRRLALLFTLLDGENKTSLEHLNQAMAAWQYCEDSAAYIFKGQAQDSVARKIVEVLREKGSLTSTEISNLFSRNIKSDRIQTAIEELVSSDAAEMVSEPTKGRPLQVLKIKHSYEKNEFNEKRFDDFGAGCSDCDEDIL